MAASPASGHQGQILPQLTGSTCPGPASESCSCNSAKSHGDQRLRSGCWGRTGLRWAKELLEGGLAITSTRPSSCCFTEFMGSILFTTPKHMVTAGLLSVPHRFPQLGRVGWSGADTRTAPGPGPAIRGSLWGARFGVRQGCCLECPLPVLGPTLPEPGKAPHLGRVESSPQDIGDTPTVDRCGEKQSQRCFGLFL